MRIQITELKTLRIRIQRKKNIADPGSDRKKQLCGLGSIEKKCCGSRSREEKALRIRILGKKQITDQDLEKKKTLRIQIRVQKPYGSGS